MIRWLSLFAAVLVIIAPLDAHAALSAEEELSALFETKKLEAGLSDESRELLGDASATKTPDFFQAVQGLLSRAILRAANYMPQSCRYGAVILAICALCGLAGGASLPGNTAQIAGIAAIAAAMFSNVQSMVRVSTDTICELGTYSQLLLPALGSAAAASGAITSGPAIYGITVLFSDALLALITRFLIPLLYIFLALAAADAALGGTVLHRMRRLTSWAIKASLKTALLSFTAFLAVTQVITGTSDALTAKAAKATISGMIPVVGSIISDATDTILAGASLLKGSIGVFGMLAVLAIAIVPILQLGIQVLIMKVTAAVGGALAPGAVVSMIDALEEALSFLLAATGSMALILLISAVCSLRVVGI